MTRSPLFRLSVAAAIAALAVGAQAREAYQNEPEAAVVAGTLAQGQAEPSMSVAALATPQHFGEATQWMDSSAGAQARSSVLADIRQARQKGLLNDTGEAGASDRVLAQREVFNQQEHDRILAEYAAADEAQRLALAEQRRQEIEAAGDPMLALLLIDETEPGMTSVTAYTPTDVSQWRATPTDSPQPTLPSDVPTASIAPAPSTELRLDDAAPARTSGTLNQGGSDDSMPDTSATARETYSDGVDAEK
jgi:hypothetical protein